MKALDKKIIKALLKPRVATSHKGDHGHALIIAGDRGRMGACIIAARACLRSGAGLLTVNVPEEERVILQTSIPEAMLMMRTGSIDLKLFSSAGIGPGLGTTAEAKKLVMQLITRFHKPLVLDADALTILSKEKSFLKKLPAHAILTPHPKEFDRLFGDHKNETERRETAIQLAAKNNLVIVLKGANTLITFNGNAVLNTTGNAGLAKGGSGDALTGMITGLLAQGYSPFDAAQIAVYLHGFAADITLMNQSPESMLISDVIKNIGEAFKKTMR